MPREPVPYELLVAVALLAVCVVAALWAGVWNLRRASQPTIADRDVQQRIAGRAAVVLPAGPPPQPPAKPVFPAGPPAAPFPAGADQHTPVWLADDTADRREVLAHRLVRPLDRTVEGYLVRDGDREYGWKTEAGLAIATRNVRFCARCWPPIPVMPGHTLPRRRPS
jgi:hypothetical protein